ncbi:MAG: hypothetical protein ACRBHB_19315 [Arenicella sp.]
MSKPVFPPSLMKYLLLLLAVMLVFVSIIITWVLQKPESAQSSQRTPTVKTETVHRFKFGPVNRCSKIPPFIAGLGLQQPVAIDTLQSVYPGLLVRELQHQQRFFQHPSWTGTGHVGSTVRDAAGNIYVIPFPSVGLDTNPMEKRNTVYKVDAVSAKMDILLHLPMGSEHSTRNPFGTMGLAIDCDTNSLYVSSVADSTPQQEEGVIYQIDLDTKRIVDKWKNTDAIGLTVFNFADEKRLYFGSARSSSVFSVQLDATGGFAQPNASARHELSLATIKNGNSTQARKFNFSRDDSGQVILTVVETEFGFRMTAETGRRFKHYPFVLNKDKKRWEYQGN